MYPFTNINRQFATIPVLCIGKDKCFGLTRGDDDLIHRTYVRKIEENSSVYKAFSVDQRSVLRDSFMIYINGDRIFNTAQATKKLEAFYKVFLKKRDQGVDHSFTFHVTFAPEPKLTGNKLKKPMDDFHGFKAGTTKRIK